MQLRKRGIPSLSPSNQRVLSLLPLFMRADGTHVCFRDALVPAAWCFSRLRSGSAGVSLSSTHIPSTLTWTQIVDDNMTVHTQMLLHTYNCLSPPFGFLLSTCICLPHRLTLRLWSLMTKGRCLEYVVQGLYGEREIHSAFICYIFYL